MSVESAKYWNNNYKTEKRYGLHDGPHINTAVLNISGSQERIRIIIKYFKIFKILIVSTNYTFVHLLDSKVF